MCEIKIQVNIQIIHTVKQMKSNNQEDCKNKMLGELYLSKIFIQWDELLFEII